MSMHAPPGALLFACVAYINDRSAGWRLPRIAVTHTKKGVNQFGLRTWPLRLTRKMDGKNQMSLEGHRAFYTVI